ncbi:lamin tail domain-containing protein [Verrucomicrobiaceae bacterium 227]
MKSLLAIFIAGISLSASHPAEAEISTVGLLDHFDPNQGVTTNGAGQVSGWTNLAAAARSVTQVSTATSVVTGPGGGSMIRFHSSDGAGHLSYGSPGDAAMSGGYTIFAVVDLETGTGNGFPRVHASESDSHSVFFRNSSNAIEFKANPLVSPSRPTSGYDGSMTVLTARVTTTSQELYFNGTLVDSSAVNIADYDLSGGQFRIGNSWVGRIGHVLVYDGSATVNDLGQTGAWLASAYGLAWDGRLLDPEASLIDGWAATPDRGFDGESVSLSWDVDASSITGALSVEIRDPGGNVVHASSSATGSHSLVLASVSGSVEQQRFTLAVSESGGGNLSDEAITEVTVDPGRPSAESQSGLETVGTIPLGIRLRGSDPNTFPNAELSYSVGSPPSNGTLSGVAPNLTYTANPGFTGLASFSFTVSDGHYSSEPARVMIEVVPVPTAPSGISISTLEIGTAIQIGDFIAAFLTSDINVGESHSYGLVNGDGDDDNAAFSIEGNRLIAGEDLADYFGQFFKIRVRSTDPEGFSVEKSFTLKVVEFSDAIVINEIHYNPPENPVREEFVELYNPASVDVDLHGWRLSSAIDFTFPAGSSIPAGGYLIIAEDPATMLATFGVTALGPFEGGLSAQGETVRLRDADNATVDEVDYRVGFPWPVSADGNGPSIELINPRLDNGLGSSWRSSSVPGSQLILIDEGRADWLYYKGTQEASTPVGAWRLAGFDSSAWSTATTPIGYGDGDDATLLTDMQGNYSTLYLRNQFSLEADAIPGDLVVEAYVDDGCVVWINGIEVARFNVPDGLLAYDATAADHEAEWQTVTVSNASDFLVEGINVVAVHGVNQSVGGSDFSFDLRVREPYPGEAAPHPTPGARNSVLASNSSPNIRKVVHFPQQPVGDEATTITASVSDPEGVASVMLEYQVVAPGAYLPAFLAHPVSNGRIPDYELPRVKNPAYDDPANWTFLTMLDDGSGADVSAGDGIYTAVIPGHEHRTMVRYRITVEDALGLAGRVPYEEDPSLNFAYFHYDGVPDYNGHVASSLTTLPVYQILTDADDWAECHAWNDSSLEIGQGAGRLDRLLYNWNGTIVYDGIVYDNIRYRLRGANGRYHQNGKRSMRFRLNEGHFLQAHDRDGKAFRRKWRTLTTGKGFENRQTLTYSLNEAVNSFIWPKTGLPAAKTLWAHWRVVDGAAEAPDQWNGDFWGLNFISETYDTRFLEEHDLPKGNLYKLINQEKGWEQQQRYQNAFGSTGGEDHDWVETELTGYSTAAEISAGVNLEKFYLYKAYSECVRNYDYFPNSNKNMVYYFEPDYRPENEFRGKLWLLPWDGDATWGPTWYEGHDVVSNALFDTAAVSGSRGGDNGSTPELWPGYFSAIREIRDLLWQPDQILPVIDQMAAFIDPMVAPDRDRWGNAPAAAGNYGSLGGPGRVSLAALVQDMKNFAFVGGSWPGGNVGVGGRAAFLDSLQASHGEAGKIPETPTIRYTGSAGFPLNDLAFESSVFADPQGAGSFGAMEWRVARITDASAPNYDSTANFKLEIESDWESGELPFFNSRVAVPSAEMKDGLTYRARVRHRDDTGRWSHWSAPFEFTTTLPALGDFENGIVISEIMYHPPEGSEPEWIELLNVGDGTLDLSDLRFTKGIDFDFLGSKLTSLGAGERVLVVSDLDAFEAQYGTSLPVAGQWETGDKLSNGGERLKLSFGGGESLRDFEYSDDSPWPTLADGGGYSLVLHDAETVPDHGLAQSWRHSRNPGGTPGTAEAEGFVGDPDADVDSDGLSAFAEYALGLSDSDATDGREVIKIDGDGILSYRRNASAQDSEVALAYSADLVDWQTVPGDGSVFDLVRTSVTEGIETVTITLPASQLRSFFRLEVSPR